MWPAVSEQAPPATSFAMMILSQGTSTQLVVSVPFLATVVTQTEHRGGVVVVVVVLGAAKAMIGAASAIAKSKIAPRDLEA